MFLNGLSVWKTNNEQEGKEEMLPVAATCYIPAEALVPSTYRLYLPVSGYHF